MRLARIIREASVEALFVKLAKARGWRAAKFVSPGWRGVPDRIVFKGDGDLEFVELKAPGQKPTLQQMRRHEQLRNLGFNVSVVDSVEAAEKWYADRV